MASDDDLSLYFTPEEVPCAELKSGAFESLSEKVSLLQFLHR